MKKIAIIILAIVALSSCTSQKDKDLETLRLLHEEIKLQRPSNPSPEMIEILRQTDSIMETVK